MIWGQEKRLERGVLICCLLPLSLSLSPNYITPTHSIAPQPQPHHSIPTSHPSSPRPPHIAFGRRNAVAVSFFRGRGGGSHMTHTKSTLERVFGGRVLDNCVDFLFSFPLFSSPFLSIPFLSPFSPLLSHIIPSPMQKPPPSLPPLSSFQKKKLPLPRFFSRSKFLAFLFEKNSASMPLQDYVNGEKKLQRVFLFMIYVHFFFFSGVYEVFVRCKNPHSRTNRQ